MIVRGDGPYPWSSFFIGSICLGRHIQLYGLKISRVFRWWIPTVIVVCLSFFRVVEREWIWYFNNLLSFPFVEKMVDFDLGWVVCLSFFRVVEREWIWYIL